MRMLIYKKISAIKTEEDVLSLTDELTDRFSDPPVQVTSLIGIALIKALAEELNITEITDNSGTIFFYFLTAKDMDFMKISSVSEQFRGQILVCSGTRPGFSYKTNSSDKKNKIGNIKKILQMLK